MAIENQFPVSPGDDMAMRLPKVKINGEYYFMDEENKTFINIHTPWLKLPFDAVEKIELAD